MNRPSLKSRLTQCLWEAVALARLVLRDLAREAGTQAANSRRQKPN